MADEDYNSAQVNTMKPNHKNHGRLYGLSSRDSNYVECTKPNAIDYIETSLPVEERKRIIWTLIERKIIKNIM